MDDEIDDWIRAGRALARARALVQAELALPPDGDRHQALILARHGAAREADEAESLARHSARRGDAPGAGSPTRLEWCRLQRRIGLVIGLRRARASADGRWEELGRELTGLREESAALEERMLEENPDPTEDDLLMASVP